MIYSCQLVSELMYTVKQQSGLCNGKVHTPLPDQIISLTTCITTKGMITVVYHLENSQLLYSVLFVSRICFQREFHVLISEVFFKYGRKVQLFLLLTSNPMGPLLFSLDPQGAMNCRKENESFKKWVILNLCNSCISCLCAVSDGTLDDLWNSVLLCLLSLSGDLRRLSFGLHCWFCLAFISPHFLPHPCPFQIKFGSCFSGKCLSLAFGWYKASAWCVLTWWTVDWSIDWKSVLNLLLSALLATCWLVLGWHEYFYLWLLICSVYQVKPLLPVLLLNSFRKQWCGFVHLEKDGKTPY